MVNYQNGKIYKIESYEGNKIYIGATTKQYLSQRFVKHRSDYNYWKSGNMSVSKLNSFNLFDEYGLENCFITLIESFPCKSKDELYARESYYIKSIVCVNKTVPTRTKKEYYNDNSGKIKTKALERYYDNNFKITCDCGSVVTNCKKTRHYKTKKHQEYLKIPDNTFIGPRCFEINN